MAQLRNLNVAPYFDDFDEDDNFHKVLFRPGFAIQARELTSLQSILQNQIERHGQHMFKEGSVVIPGQVSYSDSYFSVKLDSNFANEKVRLNQYLNFEEPVILTGETTGVKAKVTNYSPGTSTSSPYLYGDIISAGTDGETIRFANGENLSANIATKHTSSYEADIPSLKTFIESNPAVSCVQRGSAVTVESGVYFIRGQFVRCQKQVHILSPNSNKFSARIGFVILERLEVPEFDTTLTDNSTGSTNYAAKGAHRLKLKLRLSKLPLGAPTPDNFVELLQIKRGKIIKDSATTQYSVIGDELARRTYDESGDYTTKPFTFKVEEQIDNDYKGRTYKGVYGVTTGSNVITDDNIVASPDLLNLKVSTGKAYVKGYEVEKVGLTNITFGKARAFNTVNAGVSTYNVGNFVNITNVYGSPDIGEISGETTPYKEIELYTDFGPRTGDVTSNVGVSGVNTIRGYRIGLARARTMEFKSGTQGNADAIYKLFLFDIRMLTFLVLDGSGLSVDTVTVGAQVTGESSGATGFVNFQHYVGPSSTLQLTNVIGTFSQGEKLKVSNSLEADTILETDSNVDVTITEVVTHKFEEVRSFAMEDSSAASQNFSADAVLALVDDEGKILLDGTDSNALDEFDQMITDGESVVYETERVAKLIEPEKNISIFKMPKAAIKTLNTGTNDGASDTQYTVRRQFIGTTNSSGVVSFTATGSNETFVGFTDRDYMCTVLTAGGGTAAAGDPILLTGKVTGTTTSTLTITDNTLLGSGAKVKVIATILKTGVVSKVKTTNLCKQLKVIATDADGEYGTRATDRDISLGRVDAYKLVAVYDSESTSTDATTPSMTLTSVTGTFARGEKITGASSGAQARILSTTSPISYALEGNAGALDFVAGEVITGTFSKATATVGVLTAGSKVITSRFIFDTGQRDNYYDISRLTRKKGAAVPLGRLLVVYDFLSHGSGDLFTVDSYSSLNGQMEYDNIPIYSATKVDPDAPEPTGTFSLRDSFDFRPAVANITGTSTAITSVDQITGRSFDFAGRTFSGTGATVVDSPKPASSVQADFEFYIGYKAALFLARNGKFMFQYGVAGEVPKPPKDVPDTLKLASITVPPFTFAPQDVKVKRYKTQRFTMRDIGKIKDRVERLEDLTSLTLLEKSAESFEIQDQNGLNRFKSGFVVDNFKGHRVGAALNPDYKCAVDLVLGELRPKCVMRSVKLIEKNTTDEDRLAAGYRKTGDLITLPYTTIVDIQQPYATNIENVQPYVVPNWVGHIKLSPSGDDWMETETAPTINNNVMGTYDTILADAIDNNTLGTFWDAWEIFNVGVSTEHITTEWVTDYNETGYTESEVQTSIDTTTTDKKRTGVTNTLVEDIVYTTNTSVSSSLIPYCRSKRIKFTAECLMPNKRVYAFFDGVDVNAFCEPASVAFTNGSFVQAGTTGSGIIVQEGANKGSALVTNAAGKLEGFFEIPEHSFAGQENVPKFETQKELEFRLTSSPTNAKIGFNGTLIGSSTAAQTTYYANGVLETTQDTITATKNATIVSTAVDQTTSIVETGSAYTTVLQSFDTTYPPPAVVYSPPDDDYLPAIPDKDEIIVGDDDSNNTVGVCTGTPITIADVQLPVFDDSNENPSVTAPDFVTYITGSSNDVGQPPTYGGSDIPDFTGTSNSNDEDDEDSGGFGYTTPDSSYFEAGRGSIYNTYSVSDSGTISEYRDDLYMDALAIADSAFINFEPGRGSIYDTYSPPAPPPPDRSSDPNPGGEASSTVLCSLLYRRGYLPQEIWEQDHKFGAWISENDPDVFNGYHSWAVPMVNWIEKESLLSKVYFHGWVRPFTGAWAQHIAHRMEPEKYKDNKVGRLMLNIGVPLCRLIGKFKKTNNLSLSQQNVILNRKGL